MKSIRRNAPKCDNCANLFGQQCHRTTYSPRPAWFERKYTDDDFCGPSARFYEPNAREALRRLFIAWHSYRLTKHKCAVLKHQQILIKLYKAN